MFLLLEKFKYELKVRKRKRNRQRLIHCHDDLGWSSLRIFPCLSYRTLWQKEPRERIPMLIPK